jgi:general L-amino acid transport system permease protein
MRAARAGTLRGLAAQALALGLLLVALFWLGANTVDNLEQRKVRTGFAFLTEPARLPLSGDVLVDYDADRDSYGRVLLVGTLNTLLLSACAIVTATLAGTLLGLSRISANWLARRLAALYVEVVRNIPSLLIVLFVMSMLRKLGGPREAIALPGDTFLSNRGLVLPSLTQGDGAGWVVGVALTGLLATALAARAWPGRRVGMWGLAATALAAAAAWAALPVQWAYVAPRLQGFNFEGGTVVSLEFAAMLLALTVYFASYIGATVRSGILGVPAGQWDAARALGLSRRHVLRLVVLPQALRIIVPPMTNAYLGIVKASALGVAIGYQELVSVTNTLLSNTGQAIELVFILMAVYFAVSLAITTATGWLNRRLMRAEQR